MGLQQVDQPLLGVPVLGEEDDPLIGPPGLAGAAHLRQPGEQCLGTGIWSGLTAFHPRAEPVEDLALLLGEGYLSSCRRGQGLGHGVARFVLGRLVATALPGRLELGVSCLELGPSVSLQRLPVLGEGPRERYW